MENIKTPRAMIEAIAAGPSELFNRLLEVVSFESATARQLAERQTFRAHGLLVTDEALHFLEVGQVREQFIKRPDVRPKLRTKTADAPQRPARQASVLFIEVARTEKGQRFYAAYSAGPEGVILPGTFYWEKREPANNLRPRDLALHIATMAASGKKSSTDALGQLRQR